MSPGPGQEWPTVPEKSWDPVDAEQYSAELRYAARADADIQWVAGLYYYDLTSDILGNANPTLKTDETTSYAAFGQATIPLANSFRVIVGARMAYDEKSYFSSSLDPTGMEDDWNAFDWKAGAEADLSEDVLAYLTLASGHRPGGFNSFPGMGVVFDPEELVSAEIGVKSRFMDNRLQLNANLFYYDYNDFQVADFYFPEGATSPVLEINNVGAVRNYGGELETEMLITNYTIGSFGVSYLSSEYQDDFTLHAGPIEAEMEGETLPHAPELTLKAGLEHTFVFGIRGSLTPRVDVRWTDDQYVAPFPGEAQTQEAYTIVDLALRYGSPDDSWSINAYVKNAGDEATKIAYFGNSLIVGNPLQAGVVFSAKY
jgi:iron complex outermembrane receptor protein